MDDEQQQVINVIEQNRIKYGNIHAAVMQSALANGSTLEEAHNIAINGIRRNY